MDAGDYVAGVRGADRRILAKCITLIESNRPDHQLLAQQVLEQLLPATGGAVRIGVSGVPGVGKSTLIEALGLFLVQQGLRVAVLAVDPSSQRTGGSIMGDKTRMEQLATHAGAFIRPSPTGGTLGGVARKTREALLICEAAGHDVVIVETVGVGQSETAVRDMVDFFALLILPGAGDALQGIKRGIVEIADCIVVTKTDQDPQRAAQAARDYRVALELLPPLWPSWRPPVLQTNAIAGQGMAELWQACLDQKSALGVPGLLELRQAQEVSWLRSLLEQELWQRFATAPGVRELLAEQELRVRQGTTTPTAAARVLLDLDNR